MFDTARAQPVNFASHAPSPALASALAAEPVFSPLPSTRRTKQHCCGSRNRGRKLQLLGPSLSLVGHNVEGFRTGVRPGARGRRLLIRLPRGCSSVPRRRSSSVHSSLLQCTFALASDERARVDSAKFSCTGTHSLNATMTPLPRLGSRVRIPSPAPKFFDRKQ